MPSFGAFCQKIAVFFNASVFFFFFTFLLGSKGREAPRSSRGVLGAPRACPNTPRSGVSRQAVESAIAGPKMDISYFNLGGAIIYA